MFTVAKLFLSSRAIVAASRSPIFHRNRLNILHPLLMLILLLPSWAAAAPGEGQAAPWETNLVNGDIPQFSKFELTFTLGFPVDNPYDTREVKIDLLITPPSGTPMEQPAFYYQEYTVSGVNPLAYDKAVETLTPVGPPVWKVRFTPVETGIYRYTVRILRGGLNVPSEIQGTFRSVSSDQRGFIEVTGKNGANPLYFHFSNGEPFIGVGMNLGWWEDDSYALSFTQHYFGRMDEYGVNLARIWMRNNYQQNPDFPAPPLSADKILSIQENALGREYNLEDAWNFDRVLDEAAQREIYLIVTLEDGHSFGDLYWKHHNLYKGELDNPFQFFDVDRGDQDAIRYQENLFRYIIARWGYSPQIMSWELFNEIDEFFRSTSNYPKDLEIETAWTDLVTWHDQMVEFFERTDAHKHMLDTSTGSFKPLANPDPGTLDYKAKPYYPQLYANMDFAQMHLYFVDGETDKGYISDKEGRDMAYLVEHYARQTRALYPTQPFIIGEFGLNQIKPGSTDWEGTHYQLWDAAGIHLHNGLWSSLMSGSAAAGLHWHWHQIWLPDHAWWRHYAPLGAYAAQIDTNGLKTLRPTPLTASTSYTATVPGGTDVCSEDLCSTHPNIRAMGLKGKNETYVWVQNTLHTWWNETHAWQRDCLYPGSEPLSVTITVKGYTVGQPYLVEWWDPYQTDEDFMITHQAVISVSHDGGLRIPISNLEKDIALRIHPLTAALQVEREVDTASLSAAGMVQITTRVWNRGNVDLNVSVQDAACGDRSAGNLAKQGSVPFSYNCSFFVDRDVNLEVHAVGTGVGGASARAAARRFVAAPDGIVGSGVPESCSETALRTEVNGYTGSTIGFNCGPQNHLYPIFLNQELIVDRPLTLTTGAVSVPGGAASGSSVFLSGQHRTRIFDVVRPGELYLEGLRLGAGAAHRCSLNAEYEAGGALSVGGRAFAQVINGRFFANSADYGGSLQVHPLGELVLKSSRVWLSNAEALNSTPQEGSLILRGGGAAYVTGKLSLLDRSQIFDNWARNGGGIWSFNGELLIENSSIYDNSASNNGGGIQNTGNSQTTIRYSTLSRNTTVGYGGGILNRDNAALYIDHSLLDGNSTQGAGGAIANVKDDASALAHPTVNLLNVTLAKNKASGMGGALFNGPYEASVTIDSSTITGNKAEEGGGFYLSSGIVGLHNSILAGNKTFLEAASDCFQNAYNLISGGFNLIGVGGSCLQQTTPGDQIGSAQHPLNPMLGPLTQNGGWTATYALLAGSPALDAGDPQTYPVDDQRGLKRPAGKASDIGAYEMAQFSVESGAAALEGAGSMTFTVRLNGPAVQTVQVSYRTQDGTAVGCSADPCGQADFRHVSGKLTFPAGTQSLTVAAPLLRDSIPEANENFFLVLSAPTNAMIYVGTAEAWILDDSTPAPGAGMQIHLPLVITPGR